MLKIICTSAKEKKELLEASEQISNLLKKHNVNDTQLNFFSTLYRNPGSIEVVEEICVKREFFVPGKPRKPTKKNTRKYWNKND